MGFQNIWYSHFGKYGQGSRSCQASSNRHNLIRKYGLNLYRPCFREYAGDIPRTTWKCEVNEKKAFANAITSNMELHILLKFGESTNDEKYRPSYPFVKIICLQILHYLWAKRKGCETKPPTTKSSIVRAIHNRSL